MGRLFNLDSPLMVFLSKVADLMILNIITLFLCIPIITAGDAMKNADALGGVGGI